MVDISSGFLDKICKEVTRRYGLRVRSYKELRMKKDRYTILINSNSGKYILKKPRIPDRRIPFFIETQAYLYKEGIKQPSIIHTKENNAYFYYQKEPFLLFTFIESNEPRRLSKDQVLEGIRIMGRVHRTSLDFSPISDHYTIHPIQAWQEEYSKKLVNLEKWLHNHQQTNNKKLRILVKKANFFIQTAREMIGKLEVTSLKQWKNKQGNYTISHGDFTVDNLLWTKNGCYLIDFDNVGYNFPSKDFSRYLLTVMNRLEKWNPRLFNEMLALYNQTNPLFNDQKKLFLIDLIFPHQFERMIRKKLYQRVATKELKRFVEIEKNKTKHLKLYASL